MCWKNNDAQIAYGHILPDAVNLWHNALGDNRGVEFDICNLESCGSDPDSEAVQLVYQQGAAGSSILGWIPPYQGGTDAKGTGRHFIRFDPLTVQYDLTYKGDFHAQQVAILAHELGKVYIRKVSDMCTKNFPGHILGLQHENQCVSPNRNILLCRKPLDSTSRHNISGRMEIIAKRILDT
jgi:hypothetical protein